MTGKQLSPSSQEVFKAALAEFRTPAWMFSGLAIILLLIPWAFWQSGRHNEQVLARLNAPQVGDLYEVKLGDRSYTFFKVAGVSGDSIHIGVFNYETDKPRGLGTILGKEDGEFGEELTGYSRPDVLAMREDGMIMEVRDR